MTFPSEEIWVVEYTIILKANVEELRDEVNALALLGWELIGPITFGNRSTDAMTNVNTIPSFGWVATMSRKRPH